MSERPSPLIIGGVGGSGTRVFCALARASGYAMGTRVNESDDALELMGFADRWISHAVAGGNGAAMRADFHACIAAHRGGSDEPWGYKQPRSVHFLSFLACEFPQLRYLHVIRDGRDVAFGPQGATVLANAGDAVLGESWREEPEPLALIDLWDRTNRRAAEIGETLGERYLRVRFEDLCAQPAETVERIYGFFGLEGDVEQAAAEVRPPETLGRWRKARSKLLDQLHEIATPALERFGYL